MHHTVRAGSVLQWSRTGITGHQWSPSAHKNRRSPAFQLKQQARGERADQIVVPKVIDRRGPHESLAGVRRRSR
jgi:hypothetical protein